MHARASDLEVEEFKWCVKGSDPKEERYKSVEGSELEVVEVLRL